MGLDIEDYTLKGLCIVGYTLEEQETFFGQKQELDIEDYTLEGLHIDEVRERLLEAL